MNRKKVILRSILTGLIMGTIGIIMVFYSPQYKELKMVRNMPIEDIRGDMADDGEYMGDFSYGGFTYLVEVKVLDRKIDSVRILSNRTSKHAKKAEGVVQNVLRAQTANVDTITGATTTSKALLKAIENALRKGIRPNDNE